MIFGWDISTSIIGVTALNKNGNFIGSAYCDLRQLHNFFLKGETATRFVKQIIKHEYLDSDINVHYVEDKLLCFAIGRSTAGTITKLASFNSLVSWFIYELDGDTIHYMHPSTVKAILKKDGLIIHKNANKKETTLKFVAEREKNFNIDHTKKGKPQVWCYDMADSYVVARSGFLKYN